MNLILSLLEIPFTVFGIVVCRFKLANLLINRDRSWIIDKRVAYQTVHLITLVVFTSLSTLGQKPASLGLTIREIDLSGKTFVLQEGDSSAQNDLELFFIFHEGGRATFRGKRGDFIKDSPLTWRFEGDLLSVQPAPIEMIADGKVQLIDRDPIKYVVEKAPGGYLLKRKDDRTLWVEVK